MEEWERRKSERPHLRYKPNQAVRPFLISRAPVRVLSAANRWGKTSIGAVLDVCALLGFDHFRPWRTYKLPTLVWAVALDNKRLGRVLWSRIKSFLPGEEGRDWREYRNDGIIQMSKRWGKSELHLMSCEAGPDRFKGAEVDHAHLDEEPNPRGDEIFNEIYARIGPEKRLDIVMTFTPDAGATWSHGRLYDETSEDYLRGARGEKIVDFFEFSLWECDKEKGGHLTREQILERYNAYKPHERKARFFGQYSLVGANVYYDPDLLGRAQARASQKRPEHARIRIDALRQTKVERGEFPEWLLFEERIPGERYIVGFDLSGGMSRDRSVAYSIATGLKKRNPDGQIVQGDMKPRVVCRFKSGRIDPERFAREIAWPTLVYYNQALGVPERNGQFGGAFLQALRDPPIGYDNLYSDLRYNKQRMEWTGGVGWHTNETSRGMILSAHELALRESWDVYTPSCLVELGTIVEKSNPETGKSRIEASYGCHDDEAFACGLATAAHIQDPNIIMAPLEDSAEMYDDDDLVIPTRDAAVLGIRAQQPQSKQIEYDEEVFA